MRLTPLVLAGVASALPLAPSVAQLRSSRPPVQVQNLPRFLVANPFSFSAQDSAAAVRIGAGMRDKIEGVADKWFKTITRVQMNEALLQYAYPADAVLPPLVARQLAQSLNARVMVSGTLLRGEGSRLSVEARLAGLTDDAGHMVRAVQLPNQSFEEFGAKLGDSLGPAFRALPEAKNCENLRGTSALKAKEAAVKALRIVPNHGLAEWCLAQIAIKDKAPVDTVIAHLKASTKGDRLSLDAWTALAVQYQAKGDSAQTIETFKELLRVAPTNEQLRKEAFRLFQNYGRPDAAEDVADEGLKLDPANADFWDLKFGACIAQGKPEKNKCAMDALENVYALDSTKADTMFFTKMTFAASQPIGKATVTVDSTVRASVDSAGTQVRRDSVIKVTREVDVMDSTRFVKWARMGATKFPNHGYLLSQLAAAYALAGPVDSAVATAKRLMTVDSSDVTPVLRVTQALIDGNRIPEAIPLATYVERFGDDDAKTNYANRMARAALPLLQTNLPVALEASRTAVRVAPKGNQVHALANFVLGGAAILTVSQLDPEAMRTKSCDIVKQMEVLVAEATPALEIGKGISPATAAAWISGAASYPTRLAQMTKAYCK
jgi:tetratricopeptide (TPR) repeat protein